MNHLHITQNIMRQVVNLEKKRLRRWLIFFVATFIICFVGSVIFFAVIHFKLQEQQTYALLEIFQEDKEIWWDYGGDVLHIFWQEIPKFELFFVSGLLAAFMATLFVYVKRYPELDRKRKSLYDYVKEKGKIMSSESKINFAPYAILGIIIVLLLLFLYPKFQSQSKMTSSTGKVTVENEFMMPKKSSVATTVEEKQAQAKFSLTVTSPANNSTVKTNTVQIQGKTVPNADVFVNETDTKADSSGNFSVSYTLEEGENYLVVGANDEVGTSDEVELTIVYEP